MFYLDSFLDWIVQRMEELDGKFWNMHFFFFLISGTCMLNKLKVGKYGILFGIWKEFKNNFEKKV